MGFFLKREVQGAVSILLVVIMVPLMVLSALMVDTARYSLSKSMVASAGDLAMNAALADYDTILKDVYGLFAMSQVDDVEQNVKQYFEDTLVSYGVVGKEDAGAYVESLMGVLYQSMVLDGTEIANFMSMSVNMDKTGVQKVDASSLANAAILEKQIVEYMKYRGPVDFGLSFFDSLSAFTKVEEQTTVIEAQVKAQEGMGEVAEANSRLYQGIVAYDALHKKLQDDADDEFRLKGYGDILLSYRERYAAVHRLALIFCLTAYNGDSGVSRWEQDGLRILNDSGNYIWQNDGKYMVFRTYSTAFAGRSYDRNFRSEVEKQWSQDQTDSLNALYRDNAGYVTRKFSDNFIQRSNGYRCFVSEESQEKAITEFGRVDLFYKQSYSKYKDLLDGLDQYVAAAGYFDKAIEAEINKQQAVAKAEEAKKKQAEEEKEEAQNAIAKSQQNLNNWKYEEYKEELAEYEENMDKMDKMSDASEEKQDLMYQNSLILDEISAVSPPEIEVNDSFAQEVIKEKNGIEENQNTVEECIKQIAEQGVKIESVNQEIVRLQNERAEVAAQLQTVLANCETSVNAYNEDLKLYRAYKFAVKEWIDGEVKQIAEQFNQIHTNLETLDRGLNEVLEHHATARQAISSYLEKVGNWEAENQNYTEHTDGSSGDNFSMTNEEDIKSAKDTFDLEDVDELGEELQRRYDMVHNFLTAIDSNFRYMDGECIGKITTAERVREVAAFSAAGSEITAYGHPGTHSQASPDDIDRWFTYTDAIDPRALDELEKMVDPYPCCKFMNYLRQTFRQDNKKEEGGEKEGGQDAEAYEEKIDELKDGKAKLSNQIEQSGKSDGTNSMPDLGYQYDKDSKTIGGLGYPSGESAPWMTNVNKNEGASSEGLNGNKNTGAKLLDGLGNAMETGRDKLLVLSYLFENFSYNTSIQDMAREANKNLSWPGNYKSEYYYSGSKQLWQASTSSGYAINGINNPLYGAEIEYVLFGNKVPKNNVECMWGSIFAIRVMFNAIYAFTDSEIRNMARGVGMSVQAATLGIIPYQLVMVVVQLALAIGESAIDIKKMDVGEQVAIIKSRSTWMLSGSGMTNLVKAEVSQVASEVIEKSKEVIGNTINEIVDSSGDKLKEIVDGAGENLTAYTQSAVKETTDRIFARIESTVETYINEVAYFDDSELTGPEGAAKAYMVSQVDNAFQSVKTDLHSYLDGKKGEDSVEGKVCAAICDGGGGSQTLDQILDDLAETIKSGINNAVSLNEAREVLYKQVYGIRETVSEKMDSFAKGVINSATTAFKGMVEETEKTIKEKFNAGLERGEEIAKEAVVGELNTFMDGLSSNGLSLNTGSAGSLANTNGLDTSSGNLATQIKFGYSDYLKLFVFIGLCADNRNGDMIRRIGDLIQYNIANAKEGSDLWHKKKIEFTMFDAKTYISVDAVVDLDMMFLNLGIFQRQIESYNEELAEERQIDLDSTLQVHYIGIAGY